MSDNTKAAPVGKDLSSLRDQLRDNTSKLYELSGLVNLLAFACEARRILEAVEGWAEIDSALAGCLSRIEDRRDWSTYRDMAGSVAYGLAGQINDIAKSTDDICTVLARANE